MSVEAIAWALKQDIAKSSEKFVLVCLANYADDLGLCYPSIPQLCEDTSQDRKTVIASIDALCREGLLQDSGRRVGQTRQIPVYQILGLPTSQSRHYVYRVTDPETGRFYIGKRSCLGDPQQDTLYKGSGRWTRAAMSAGVVLLKEVIEEFGSSVEALAAEQKLFRQHENDPLCMNEGTPAKSRAKQLQNRNSSEKGTVPNIPSNSPVFPSEQSRFSVETVPETVHGTVKEPSGNRQGTTKPRAAVPDWVPEVEWKAFLEMRNAGKARLTEHAKTLAVAKLDELRRQGYPPGEVLNQSVMNGWKGLFPLKAEGKANGNGGRFNPRAAMERAVERIRTAGRVDAAAVGPDGRDVWGEVLPAVSGPE